MTLSPDEAPLASWKPPAVPIPSLFERVDDKVDAWFEQHLRNRPIPDAIMYTASAVGDHGIVWLTLAGVQAVRAAAGGRDWRRPLLRASAGLGLESALVNGPVKWMFRRSRPVHHGPRPRHLRNPRTSSFPSGHATAAFFGAALLRDRDPLWPLYYLIAVVVASSRVHVKIHHASDVIGGVIIGAALGELARHLVPLEPARVTRV
jgi:undecaprenyl-diphosphatase